MHSVESNDYPAPAIAQPKHLRCPELDRIARYAVDELQTSPCAVVACARLNAGAYQILEGAYGKLFPDGPEASPDTFFDLASITKPFVALTLARLVRANLVEFRSPLGLLLGETRGTPSNHVPLDLLMAHRAGLEGHRPLYAPLTQGKPVHRHLALREAACARRPECVGPASDEGFDPLYSDLGYLLLGEALSRAAGCTLDVVIEREVCSPLGCTTVSSARRLRTHRHFDSLVAPTEYVPWRGGIVRGAVHDENAWAMGSTATCGHAGLFGTARDVTRLGVGVLQALRTHMPGWLTPDEIMPLVRRRPGGSLRAGFDGKSLEGSSAGTRCGPNTMGHLGFTGTSLWIDPDQDAVVVMLTNRVHPSRANEAMKRARPVIHDALFEVCAKPC